MKRFVIGFILALVLVACGPSVEPINATVNLSAPDGYAVNCATNYIRLVPHHCSRSDAGLQFAADFTVGCRSTDVSGGSYLVPVSARRLHVRVTTFLRSTNAIGLRTTRLRFFHDSGCVTFFNMAEMNIREEVAVVANTDLFKSEVDYIIPVTSGIIYYEATRDNTNDFATVTVLGYYD